MPSISLYIPERTYFGGDIVDGVITFDVQKRLQARGIVLEFRGVEIARAKVDGKPTNKEEHTFISKWKRFFQAQGKPGEPQNYEPDKYYIPFAFTLPPQLPASLKSDAAEIKYEFKVSVDILKHVFDASDTVPLLVGGNIFDDDVFQADCTPIVRTGDKKILVKGRIRGEASIPKSNFYIGENCPIKVKTDNDSQLKLRGVRAYVRCRCTCSVNGHIGTSLWHYDATKFEVPVTQHAQDSHICDFEIPSVTPTIHPLPGGNKNVAVECEIVLVFDIKHYPDFEIVLPITIMARNPKSKLERCTSQQECSHCHTKIFTLRYKCRSCPSYDLCFGCLHVKPCVHPLHAGNFVEMACLMGEGIDEVLFVDLSKDKTNKVKKALYPVGNFLGGIVGDITSDIAQAAIEAM